MCKILKNRFLSMLLTLSIVMSMLGVLPIGVFAVEQESQSGDYTFVELNGHFCAITKHSIFKHKEAPHCFAEAWFYVHYC